MYNSSAAKLSKQLVQQIAECIEEYRSTRKDADLDREQHTLKIFHAT